MSDPRRAALLLAHAHPTSRSERESFAAQHLACRLYASNHDLVIVGLYGLIATEGEVTAAASAQPDDSVLPTVDAEDVDLVLAVTPPPDDDASARFATALEQLRAQQVDVVMVDRPER